METTIVVSPSELSALHTIPVELVPAPGAGNVIIGERMVVEHRALNVPMQHDAGAVFTVVEGVEAADPVLAVSRVRTDLLTGSIAVCGVNAVNSAVSVNNAAENKALLLTCDQDPEPNEGSDATLRVTVTYSVLAL